MAITIYDSDYDALWQKANPSTLNSEYVGFSETLKLVLDCLGQGYIGSINLHGIKLLLFNYQLHDDLFLIKKGQNTEIIREFGLNLSGDRCGKRTEKTLFTGAVLTSKISE